MRYWSRHIVRIMGGMLMLLGQACSSSDSEDQKVTPVLQIHVFTPEHPMVTRANIGPVEAEQLERTVNNLKIWVFRSDNGEQVGYLNPSKTNLDDGATYLMTVSDQFATEKPKVDVYAIANVKEANSGITMTFNESTTRDQLDAAIIKHTQEKDPFGLTAPLTEPTSDGLPMSGVIKNQTVGGLAPVLTVGTVQVVRAVSKVRFIFSQSSLAPADFKINSITLNDGVIPKEEYLFLNGAYTERNSHVNTEGGYEESATLATFDNTFVIPQSDNPARFAWSGAISGQEYETLINTELTKTETETVKREIVEARRFYFRESDKLVGGKIYYTINNEEKSVDFSLKAEGDFSRNHTWIVYGYFAGNNNLRIFTVAFTEWTDLDDKESEVPNW